jgi:hypothetical protein
MRVSTTVKTTAAAIRRCGENSEWEEQKEWLNALTIYSKGHVPGLTGGIASIGAAFPDPEMGRPQRGGPEWRTQARWNNRNSS